MDNIDQRIDLINALNVLTPRQRKVLILWAAGYTHKEIADEFGLERSTITKLIAGTIHILRRSRPFNSEGSM